LTTLPSRRVFVSSAAACLFGGGIAFASRLRAQVGRRERKNALSLPANDPVFKKYADAVRAMHELPQTDGRNWIRQAKIHADHCTHGTIDFLPWHRHYLNQFEQICGELIGDNNFALPYWDWTYGRGKLPDAFFDIKELDVAFWKDPGAYRSPGWGPIDSVPVRGIVKGFGVQDDPVRGGNFTSRNINSIIQSTSFDRFNTRIEGSPHNSGHILVGVGIGQPKSGHMGDGLSPLDPIFWLHHCNVDRLWAQWQLGGHMTPSFEQQYMSNFVDKKGMSVDVTAQDAIDFDALGYAYQDFSNPREVLNLAGLVNIADDQPLRATFAGPPRVAVESARELGGVKPTAQFAVNSPTSIKVPVQGLMEALGQTRTALDVSLPTVVGATGPLTKEKLSQFGRPIKSRRRILCRLEGVTTTSSVLPFVNVFINCPYLESSTPYTDIHYADSFSFFGSPAHGKMHPGHGEGQTFLVDLTDAIGNANLTELSSIKVQLMPVTQGNINDPGSISVAAIKILSV
jgi:tyrosinase